MKNIALVCKTLSHENRINILNAIAKFELNVQQIEQVTDIHQPTLSQQLKVLREAKIVATRRDGKQIYYRVHDTRVMHILDRATELYKEVE